MTSTRSCSRCKTVAEPQDEFCLNCGLRLEANSKHFRTGNIVPLPPGNELRIRGKRRRQKSRGLFKRTGTLFVVVILAAASIGLGTWRVNAEQTWNPEDVVSSITLQLKSGMHVPDNAEAEVSWIIAGNED